MVRQQRLQQKLPMCGDGRGPVPASEGKVLRAVLVIGSRQDRTAGREPFDLPWAMPALAVLLPISRVGPAETEHRILRRAQRQIVGVNLDRQYGEVDVIKEVEIDMSDFEQEWPLFRR